MIAACFSRPVERPAIAGLRGERANSASERCCAARIFGVLERQVEEPAARTRRARDRVRASTAVVRGRQRARVAGERARRVAKDVARELVEQQHARERAVRRRAPLAGARRRARRSTASPKRGGSSASNAGSLRNQTSRASRAAAGRTRSRGCRSPRDPAPSRYDSANLEPCANIRSIAGTPCRCRRLTSDSRSRDAHLLPRHLPARLLPGAAAHQRRRAHLDERARRLLAGRHEDARDARRDDLRAGLGAVATMPASLWMARVGRRARLHDRRADQHRRLRARGVRAVPTAASRCTASRPRSSASTTRSACSTASPRPRSRRPPTGARDLAGARRRHRRRLPRARRSRARARDLFADAVPRLVRRARGVRARRARRAVAGARARSRRRRSAPAADGRSRRSCASRCSSSPRWPARSATAS